MPDQELMEEVVRRIAALENLLAKTNRGRDRIDVKNRRSNTVTISSNQNNYDTGYYDLIYFETDGSTRDITGIANGIQGWQITFILGGSGSLRLMNNNAGSSVGNRILTTTAANITLVPIGTATLVYSGSAWIVKSFET